MGDDNEAEAALEGARLALRAFESRPQLSQIELALLDAAGELTTVSLVAVGSGTTSPAAEAAGSADHLAAAPTPPTVHIGTGEQEAAEGEQVAAGVEVGEAEEAGQQSAGTIIAFEEAAKFSRFTKVRLLQARSRETQVASFMNNHGTFLVGEIFHVVAQSRGNKLKPAPITYRLQPAMPTGSTIASEHTFTTGWVAESWLKAAPDEEPPAHPANQPPPPISLDVASSPPTLPASLDYAKFSGGESAAQRQLIAGGLEQWRFGYGVYFVCWFLPPSWLAEAERKDKETGELLPDCDAWRCCITYGKSGDLDAFGRVLTQSSLLNRPVSEFFSVRRLAADPATHPPIYELRSWLLHVEIRPAAFRGPGQWSALESLLSGWLNRHGFREALNLNSGAYSRLDAGLATETCCLPCTEANKARIEQVVHSLLQARFEAKDPTTMSGLMKDVISQGRAAR